MGQARLKLLQATAPVTFDFTAAPLYISKADAAQLTADKATRIIIIQLVQAAFPQGMDRADGKVWAAWQEILDDEALTAEMPYSLVQWLRKHAENETLKLPAMLSQWREALVDYLAGLKPDVAE